MLALALSRWRQTMGSRQHPNTLQQWGNSGRGRSRCDHAHGMRGSSRFPTDGMLNNIDQQVERSTANNIGVPRLPACRGIRSQPCQVDVVNHDHNWAFTSCLDRGVLYPLADAASTLSIQLRQQLANGNEHHTSRLHTARQNFGRAAVARALTCACISFCPIRTAILVAPQPAVPCRIMPRGATARTNAAYSASGTKLS